MNQKQQMKIKIQDEPILSEKRTQNHKTRIRVILS